MKRLLHHPGGLFCVWLACVSTVAQAAPTQWVYIGSRKAGAAQGIHLAGFDAGSGQLTAPALAAQIPQGTFQVVDAKSARLYSVSEVNAAPGQEPSVYSLAIDRSTGALHVLNKVRSEGDTPAHLSLDTLSRTLFVANYGSGSIASFPIRKDGSLDAAVTIEQHSGTGPSPRQKGPHAHSVLLDPSRRFLLSADLGADRIFVYHFDTSRHALMPNSPPAANVAAGAGPRHIAFHPGGKLLVSITELNAQLQTWRWDARTGQLEALQTASLVSPGFEGTPSAAEVLISADGRFVYASNRSEDAILVFALDARSGALQPLQRIAADGRAPWAMNFDTTGGWLLVANTGSNSVSVFGVDRKSGRLAAPHSKIEVPSADSVLCIDASR